MDKTCESAKAVLYNSLLEAEVQEVAKFVLDHIGSL